MKKATKYIVMTGGVLSGLGKGVTLASIGFLFSDSYKVSAIKLDGYLNTDPGTMNPIEHGEVFVLEDGAEVDMDFGHYERFLGTTLTKTHSITMGKIFKEVRLKERKGDFLGKTVQFVPHVTDHIQNSILKTTKEDKCDIMLIEVGGTVGDLENELFIEALRQLKMKVGEENIHYIHLTYIPIPYGVKEQKTKPTQQSVGLLQKKGIWPDAIIARCGEELTNSSKKKIALFSNVDENHVFSAPDVKSIYRIPSILERQGVVERICSDLKIKKPKKKKLETWRTLLNSKQEKKLSIAIAGKYTSLEDSYASVVEALEHCSYHLNAKIEVLWFDTEKDSLDKLKKCQGIIVPGGFGARGAEGKIKAIEYARIHNIPYLGICYGLHLAVVEFLRNVCKKRKATSFEINPKANNPAITLLDEQKKVVKMGGTMRLGSCKAKLGHGIILDLYSKFKLINKGIVNERHRHRYEVNPEIVKTLKKNGMIISGKSTQRNLVEFIELDRETHPYFVATQAHPELKSKLEQPAPLFYGLVKAAIKKN